MEPVNVIEFLPLCQFLMKAYIVDEIDGVLLGVS